MTSKILTSPFPAATEKDWMVLVEAGLKGADFEDALIKFTDDGLQRGPLSTRSDVSSANKHARSNPPDLEGRPWHISAPVRDPEITYANTQALRDLEGGASALRLTLDPSGTAGTPVRTVNDFKRVFEGVYTNLIPVSLAPGIQNIKYASLLAAQDSWKDIDLSLGVSVYADALITGTKPDLSIARDTAEWVSSSAPKWKTVTVNGRALHDRGASEAQELSFMAAAIVGYVRAMLEEGLTATQAFNQIAIELAVDQDGHLGIAKIRAARHIWSCLATSFNVPNGAVKAPIHAITSMRMMTRQDPWTNMLRIMAAGFGAVCGGADYITTRPFTDAMGHATNFGHRIARNMQLLMMEESHLGQVMDPANGSFFHERVTHTLAKEAWSKFQDIEVKGGIEAVIASGQFAKDIQAAHQIRTEAVEAKTRKIVGVTLYPGQDLRKAKTRQVPKSSRSNAAPVMTADTFIGMKNEATSGHAITVENETKTPVLPIVRLSEHFENGGDSQGQKNTSEVKS